MAQPLGENSRRAPGAVSSRERGRVETCSPGTLLRLEGGRAEGWGMPSVDFIRALGS